MGLALSLGKTAASLDEVPVGAIVVRDKKILGCGFNRKEALRDPSAHAEVLAIRDACNHLGGWRLNGCTIYVTLEPCVMCAGLIHQARVSEVVYGCRDPKSGALSTLYRIGSDDRLNHQFGSRGGVLGEDCSGLLKDFFCRKRV